MYGPGPDSGKAEAAGPYPSPVPPFPGAEPGGTSVRLGRPGSPPPALTEEGTQGSRLRERKHGGACEPVGRDVTRMSAGGAEAFPAGLPGGRRRVSGVGEPAGRSPGGRGAGVPSSGRAIGRRGDPVDGDALAADPPAARGL